MNLTLTLRERVTGEVQTWTEDWPDALTAREFHRAFRLGRQLVSLRHPVLAGRVPCPAYEIRPGPAGGDLDRLVRERTVRMILDEQSREALR